MFTRFVLGLSLITGVLYSHSAIAAPDGASSGLTGAQQRSLQNLGLKVAVPAYVPAGFKVTQLVAERCPASAPRRGLCREGPYYTIVYRNAQNTCLLINAIGGGVGGPDSEFEFSTTTKLLGEVVIGFNSSRGQSSNRQQFGQTPTTEQLNTPQPNLSSFPAMAKSGRSPYYNVVSSGSKYYKDTYRCSENRSITPLELEKVLQSLVWLR